MHKARWSFIKDFLTPEQCDNIVELGELFDREEGRIPEFTPDGKKNPLLDSHRKCKIAWFTYDAAEALGVVDEIGRIYETIDSQFNSVLNVIGLHGLDISTREAFQYTEYFEGDHYGWHKDAHDEPYPYSLDEYGQAAHPYGGKIRKMSMSIFLNDPKEWEGGDLEIEDNWNWGPDHPWNRIQKFGPSDRYRGIKKGSAIIFQSDTWHRVTRVTEGNRKSLVAWFVGDPYV